MYKVFFNDSFLIITNNDYNSDKNIHAFHLQSFNQLEKWVHEAEIASSPINLICHTDNVEDTWQKFCSLFRVIEAAGGLVSNTDKEYLCIFRRGSWDLPKGKIDKDETPEETAIREVREETGLKELLLEKHIIDTYHIYKLKERLVLKRTYWYQMANDSNGKLIPQTEEDIEKALWLKANDIKPLMTNMFGSVKDVLIKARVINIE
jgi:8-oxo-dGTP pyrophosphatase MutT (NUDIX family)